MGTDLVQGETVAQENDVSKVPNIPAQMIKLQKQLSKRRREKSGRAVLNDIKTRAKGARR